MPVLGRARVSGSTGRTSETSSGEQWEFEREHTLISLLNLLRRSLLDHGIAKRIDDNPTVDLIVGDIVEFQGALTNNPFAELKELWETYLKMRPYFDEVDTMPQTLSNPNRQRKTKATHKSTPRSKPVGDEEERLQMIIDMSSQGIEDSGLLDIHMRTSHELYESAVLTLRLESSPARSLAYGKGSRCTVIGKITGMTENDEMILMYRRSGLRMFPYNLFREVFKPLQNIEGLIVELDDVAVEAPALQILPLAIFV